MKKETLIKKVAAIGKENFRLIYRTRRNIFVNYKESCAYDPITGEAHSYRWYSLARVIKGYQVLNTYGYSNCTSKHVSYVRSTMYKLGVDYIEIQAPRGLQDMQFAHTYCVNLYAKRIVANKYARKPIKPTDEQELLDNLEKLGFKTTKKQVKGAIKAAEEMRRRRLDRKKVKRDRAKAYAEQRAKEREQAAQQQPLPDTQVNEVNNVIPFPIKAI